jgi:hypothetical protein
MLFGTATFQLAHEHAGMRAVRKTMTPPPAARAPPLRGLREGEEKINHAALAPNSRSISP